MSVYKRIEIGKTVQMKLIAGCINIILLALISTFLTSADAASLCSKWRYSSRVQHGVVWYFDTIEYLDAVYAAELTATNLYPQCLITPYRTLTDAEYSANGCSRGIATAPGQGAHICAMVTVNERCIDGAGFPESATALSDGYLLSAGIDCIFFFLGVPPAPQPQLGSCPTSCVGHPINPASGAMFDTINDASSPSGSLPFKRFYNSTDSTNGDLSSSWRHSYDRSVVIKYSTLETQPYIQSASTSSQYADPATACTSGFAEIQAKVPNWTGAISSYLGGNCQLTKNGMSIGSIAVYSTGSSVIPNPTTPVAFDVTRDDGQLIRFIVNNGVITAAPGISLKLQQTALGFTVTDSNDNVEQYDTTGKLLSITSRSGVVQTMSYDTQGRLNGVSDTFGHQLMMGYDTQNRLISVTRP